MPAAVVSSRRVRGPMHELTSLVAYHQTVCLELIRFWGVIQSPPYTVLHGLPRQCSKPAVVGPVPGAEGN